MLEEFDKPIHTAPRLASMRGAKRSLDEKRTDAAINAILSGKSLEPVEERSGWITAPEPVRPRKEPATEKPARKKGGFIGPIPVRENRYEPTWLHVFIATVALIMLWQPLLLPLLVALFLVVVLVSYWTLGHERVVELAGHGMDWLELKRPDLAGRIRQRLIRASKFAGRIVDVLPARWTEGLYLPDFEPADDLPEKMRSDPFERLKGTRRDP